MTHASADSLGPAHPAPDGPNGPTADPTVTATADRTVTANADRTVTAAAEPTRDSIAAVDLDAIERDLSGVDVALQRLADGTYWTDEVTGETIPEHVLVRNPIARRA